MDNSVAMQRYGSVVIALPRPAPAPTQTPHRPGHKPTISPARWVPTTSTSTVIYCACMAVRVVLQELSIGYLARVPTYMSYE